MVRFGQQPVVDCDSHVRTCTPVYTVQEAMPIQVGGSKTVGGLRKVRDFLSFFDFRVSVFWILLVAIFLVFTD